MIFLSRKFVAVASMVLLFAGSGLMAPDVEARKNRGYAKTSTNKNVNRNRNKNTNRNVNVNNRRRHPVGSAVAVAVAVTAAAVVTAAVVGSIVHTLPPACTVTVVGAVTYQQCGSTWYQPQYVGTNVQYVVVNSPQ